MPGEIPFDPQIKKDPGIEMPLEAQFLQNKTGIQHY